MTPIPFNKPYFVGTETEYLARCFENSQTSGDGIFSRKCHVWLEKTVGAKRALLTTSCTHALEMAAILLDFAAGDEVIIPSFTFVSVANAFVLRGARPVFVDVRADTLNLDETKLEAKITPRTKAIVVVHYAGIGCEMREIMRIAAKYGVVVIEDNAHGLLGKYAGENLGAFGALAAQSFHETKNFACGEGGALLINDEKYVERAEIIREKGTNRSRFFRGQIDKYTWVDIGSSYLLSDLLAACLFAQFEVAAEIQRKREKIWRGYEDDLRVWATENNVRLPFVPAECEPAFHLFYLILPTLADRQALIAHLKKSGIMAVFHYLPLHLSEMGAKFGGLAGDCPVTETVGDCLVRLPFFNDLRETEQEFIIEQIKKFQFVNVK